MDSSILKQTAQALVANHKGILADDESTSTIKKRFDAIGIEATEENRRAYREMLFTAPGIERYISGVIMFDETIRQAAKGGVPFPKLLSHRSIIPGIKVDQGTIAFADSKEELITIGLDGLSDRLKEYKSFGARFAKWRAVIKIGDGIPTTGCLVENAKALARYAKICQEFDLVPIVEPEVLMAGAHTLERCFEVTSETQRHVFTALKEMEVYLPGILLKPNMIVGGEASTQKAAAGDIAAATVRCLQEQVPKEVPGIVFLSGGQTEEEATQRLRLMNKKYLALPWKLSFSYGRALQASALKAWQGKEENISLGQAAFLGRAKLNSLACAGKDSADAERA